MVTFSTTESEQKNTMFLSRTPDVLNFLQIARPAELADHPPTDLLDHVCNAGITGSLALEKAGFEALGRTIEKNAPLSFFKPAVPKPWPPETAEFLSSPILSRLPRPRLAAGRKVRWRRGHRRGWLL
jgi:hypothetical protein